MRRSMWLVFGIVIGLVVGTTAFAATNTIAVNPGDRLVATCVNGFTNRVATEAQIAGTCRGPATTSTTSTTTTTKPPVTTTKPPVTTTRPPATTTTRPPPPPSGLHVTNGQIVDGAGRVFKPIGANVGTYANFDWHGVANGHSAEARQWGWNTIRLSMAFESGFASEADNVANAEAVADEYTAAGIVVIITSHDTVDAATQSRVQAVYRTLATRYVNNPLVWFDPNNEPNVGTTTEWANLLQPYINLIRAVGNTSIISPDAIQDAEDANWDPDYLINYAGRLSDPAHNLVFQIHNYGSYQDTSGYQAHLDQLKAAGFAVITGETGYKMPPYEDPGHKAGTLASLATTNGVLVWHGTHGDGFTLRQDPCPFYEMTCALSDMGSKLWALTH